MSGPRVISGCLTLVFLRLITAEGSDSAAALGSPFLPIGNKPWLKVVGAKPKLKMGNGILGIGIPKMESPSSPSPLATAFSSLVPLELEFCRPAGRKKPNY